MTTNAIPTMTNDTHQLLASQLRAAGDALITTPSTETYNQMSRAVTALARAGVAGEAMGIGCSVLLDISDRYGESAAITVTEREAELIRTAIASIDKALPALHVHTLKQAIAETDVNCASVGA